MLNTAKFHLSQSRFLSGRKILFLFIIVYCTLVTDNCLSQWQPDVRLTNDPSNSNTSLNNARCIAASGSFSHVVWEDERDGNDEIYYKRSTDAGVSWGADTRLTNNAAESRHPSVTVSGSVVHVVWFDNRDGPNNYEIYYKRSTDGGVSWAAADTRLTNNAAFSVHPSVSVSGSVVHVVWHDTRNVGNSEIYYKRSIDGGVSWVAADTRLTNNAGDSHAPSSTVSGSMVHVVWQDNRDGANNWEIYYKRSTDEGVSWGADTRLTNNPAISTNVSVSVSGSVVHVVWYDLRDGNYEIYYKRSTDGGVSWAAADTRLTNNAGDSYTPSVTVSGSVVHVVWYDNRDGNGEIYYKRSTDEGVSWGADTRLTNNPASSAFPSVSVSGSVVHVVWESLRDGNLEIYYKRDPTGNPIGIINIGSEIPSEYSLGQNYPNPFNPVTNIKLQILKTGFVSLKVYDVSGKESALLVSENLSAGVYNVDFDASHLASGVYFYRLETEGFTDVKKMIVLK